MQNKISCHDPANGLEFMEHLYMEHQTKDLVCGAADALCAKRP